MVGTCSAAGACWRSGVKYRVLILSHNCQYHLSLPTAALLCMWLVG